MSDLREIMEYCVDTRSLALQALTSNNFDREIALACANTLADAITEIEYAITQLAALQSENAGQC